MSILQTIQISKIFENFSSSAGYFVSFLTLNFIVICEIWWELFGVATSYTINLIAVAIVSLGCTSEFIYFKGFKLEFFIKQTIHFSVQQSSFYGFTSMLPSRYTQAVMAGESKLHSLTQLKTFHYHFFHQF